MIILLIIVMITISWIDCMIRQIIPNWGILCIWMPRMTRGQLQISQLRIYVRILD